MFQHGKSELLASTHRKKDKFAKQHNIRQVRGSRILCQLLLSARKCDILFRKLIPRGRPVLHDKPGMLEGDNFFEEAIFLIQCPQELLILVIAVAIADLG